MWLKKTFYETIKKIVASDHGGHDKLHGTDHSDDYRLPLIVVSGVVVCKDIQDKPFQVTELKALIEKAITTSSCSGRTR